MRDVEDGAEGLNIQEIVRKISEMMMLCHHFSA